MYRFTCRIRGMLEYEQGQKITIESVNNALYLNTKVYRYSLSDKTKPRKTEREALSAINQKYSNNSLMVTGFVKYIGCQSICIVKCVVHGNMSEFRKPWRPKLYRMMFDKPPCPKCNASYRYADEERIEELNNMLDKRETGLSVVALVRQRGKATQCEIICKKHGYGHDWGNPWQPTIYIIKKIKKGCLKCSGNYQYTEKEALVRVQNVLDRTQPHMHILGFVDYIGKYSRCYIHCYHHGEGKTWQNPWTPAMDVMLRGFGCTKCSKTYSYTVEERIVGLNKKIENTHWSVLSIEGNRNKARCHMTCSEHGNGDEWGNPWRPTVNDVDNGYGCPKCQGNYRKTALEAQSHVNKNLTIRGFHHNVIGFVDEYIGKESLCQIHCEKHGDANIWENPWQPRLHDLNMKRIDCLKCSGEYNLGESEAKDAINHFIAPKNIRVNGFDRFFLNEKVNSSRCIMHCHIHGSGNVYTPQWRPTLGDLKSGTGCPLCGFEGRMLQHCLTHTELFSLPRYLYYLTLKVKGTEKRIYKIGVRTRPLLSSRYSLIQLKNSGLSPESEWIQCYPNIITLLVEYWILHTNARFLHYQPLMRRRGIEGATECFNVDISADIGMEHLVRSALDNVPNILEIILGADTRITTVLKHIEPLKEQVIASLATRRE